MNKQKALERLKTFKKNAPPLSSSVKESLKKQNKILKVIKEAIMESPKTVPQIAEISGVSAYDIFWYINALRKYGAIIIDKEEGSYLLYKPAHEEDQECAFEEKR